jgi:ferrochelatase
MNSQNSETGLLLVNLGTPDSPKTSDVRRYLKQFLLDGRVIDIPWIARQILVRGIIAPFRAPKSAKVYQSIWMPEGSPLMVYGERLAEAVQERMGPEVQVELAMRYQNPSIESAIDRMLENGIKQIAVLSLFPQYASATTGSVYQEVMDVVRRKQIIPQLYFADDYYDSPGFISCFAQRGEAFDLNSYDHILFSYHGLPERQIRKADLNNKCLQGNCCGDPNQAHSGCYRAQCFATTRALSAALDLKEDQFSTCFQSRLGRDPWIQPYTSDVLEELAEKGVKRVLVFCPAFVADCIETIDEIAEEYKEEFLEMGGEELDLVPSLNDMPSWADEVARMGRQLLQPATV